MGMEARQSQLVQASAVHCSAVRLLIQDLDGMDDWQATLQQCIVQLLPMLHQSRLRCLALENRVEHQSNHGTAHRQQGWESFQGCCQVGGICRKHRAVKGDDDIPHSCQLEAMKLSQGMQIIRNPLAWHGFKNKTQNALAIQKADRDHLETALSTSRNAEWHHPCSPTPAPTCNAFEATGQRRPRLA